MADSARRYLGVDHGHEAMAAHQQAVEAVRAVARRQGDGAWRLVGLRIRLPEGQATLPLSEFIDAHRLEEFSQSEALSFYKEACPPDRRTARSQRLRERQLLLLRSPENQAAESPQACDLVGGWFDEAMAAKLLKAGMVTLGDLNARISTGGVWWRALPGVGVAKARRIQRHLATLLAPQTRPPRALFVLNATPALGDAPRPTATSTSWVVDNGGSAVPDRPSPSPALPSLLGTASDLQAVQR